MATLTKSKSPRDTQTLNAVANALDGPVKGASERVRAQVKNLRGRRIDVTSFDLAAASGDDSRLHTRAKEVVLARVFEFHHARATDALERAGVDVSECGPLELTSRATLARLADRTDRAAVQARICIDELEALKGLYLGCVSYLVPSIVQKYVGVGVDRDDLEQEAFLGLLRAMEGYDWRRGVRFSTYAKYWIQDRVLKAIYDQARTVRLPAWVQKLWQKMSRVQSENGDQNTVVLPSAQLAGRLDVSERRLKRVTDSRRGHVSIDASMDSEEGASYAELLTDPNAEEAMFASDRAGLQTTIEEVLGDLPEREARIIERRFGLRGGVPESLQRIGRDLGLSAERVRQLQQSAITRLKEHARVLPLRDCLA